MFEVVNKLLAACISWLFALPLIMLQTGLSFFLFIDKLLEGEYREAFKTLLLSPFKALITFFLLSSLASAFGWERGFTEFFRSSGTQVSLFFKYLYKTEPTFFFAVMLPDVVGLFEGAYVGRVLNQLTLLLMSNQMFELYEHHDDSPHNPLQTMTMNEGFKLLVDTHGVCVEHEGAEIHQEISAYLKQRVDEALPEEQVVAKAAVSCLARFKQETTECFSKRAMDLSSKTPPNSLYALYIIWLEVKKRHTEDGLLLSKQALLASYLGHIQRGFKEDNVVPEDAPDDPECPTGALGILLSVLVVKPTLIESTDKIRRMLNEKLTQRYNLDHNMEGALSDYLALSVDVKEGMRAQWTQEKFIVKNRKVVGYYAQFLNETSQGRRLTQLGPVKQEDLNAMIEATFDAWSPPSPS